MSNINVEGSTCVRSYGWEPNGKGGDLRVEFVDSGRNYVYNGVTNDSFNRFASAASDKAQSTGRVFNSEIKRNFPARRMETANS